MKVSPLFRKSGFSIIEVLVGILIFSLGLVAVFALISSSLQVNDYNKNYIIASNLAREQIELIKNIRDTNYKTLHKWNQINPNGTDYTNPLNFFQTGSYYKVENDFRPIASFPTKVERITNFGEGKNELRGKMKNYQLCISPQNIYTYDCNNPQNKSSDFYRYLKIEEVKYASGGSSEIEKDAFKITSKVIWNMRGYYETEISTILSDWKRL